MSATGSQRAPRPVVITHARLTAARRLASVALWTPSSEFALRRGRRGRRACIGVGHVAALGWPSSPSSLPAYLQRASQGERAWSAPAAASLLRLRTRRRLRCPAERREAAASSCARASARAARCAATMASGGAKQVAGTIRLVRLRLRPPVLFAPPLNSARPRPDHQRGPSETVAARGACAGSGGQGCCS
jgi:hypothetical protein